MIEAIIAATAGSHEWEVSFRRNGEKTITVTVWGPQLPSSQVGVKTRPYEGVLVPIDVEEQVLKDTIRDLRKKLERQLH